MQTIKEYYYDPERGKGISEKIYYLDDDWHRLDGPAYISYDRSGKVDEERYYVNDKRIYVNKYVQRMKESTNKTQLLCQILNTEKEQRCEFFYILTAMFEDDIDQAVVNNLGMFL